MMKRILVTGGSGFIGRQTLDLLQARGFEVHVAYLHHQLKEYQDCRWHRVDLFDSKAINSLMEKIRPEYLLHLAWDTTSGKYWTSEENFTWVTASLELLKAFQKHGGRRVVMAGSCAEYDWNYGYYTENVTPKYPASLYGNSKLSLSQLLRSYSETVGLSFTWGYIFYLYGPYEKEARLVPMLINNIINWNTITLSSRSDVRDYLYVTDVAEAFVRLLDVDFNGEVNISSGIPVSVEQIVQTVTNYLGGWELISYSDKSASTAPKFLVGNNELLRKVLNWQPQVSLTEGVHRTVDWWRSVLLQNDSMNGK